MKAYYWTFPDSSADESPLIIVWEHNKSMARREAMNVLKRLGRTEIDKSDLTLTKVKDIMIDNCIYSNVEKR